MAWHHVAGLVSRFFVLTWIVSAWLSMNPNGWLQRGGVNAAMLARYAGIDAGTPDHFMAADHVAAWHGHGCTARSRDPVV